MSEGPPKLVACDKCKAQMHRDWSGSSIQIPDYMRAGAESDLHADVCRRMKHGPRPSGKSKSLY